MSIVNSLNNKFPSPEFANGVISRSSTALIGYSDSALDAVTQATSKTTTVSIDSPAGIITTHNAQMSASSSVIFLVNNSLVSVGDVVRAFTLDHGGSANYAAETLKGGVGYFRIRLTNYGGISSDNVPISFIITKAS